MAKILLFEKVFQAWFDGFAGFLRERQPEGLPLVAAECDEVEHARTEELLAEADVMVVGLVGQHHPLDRAAIAKAPKLRLIQKLGCRATGIDVQAAREAGVQVSLLPAPAHVACAEHTILLILALAKQLIPAHQRVAKRPLRETGPEPRAAAPGNYTYNWANLQGIGVVAGKTLGLVGMGDVAMETARRAKALGLRVLYYHPERLPEAEERELGVEHRELDAMLAEADIVSLHVGLCPETEKLINAERLAMMKPSALLVNTARGGLVDEAALAEALEKGRLMGAALDVWAVEPTPRDNPLLKLDNVVATPHVAAGTLSKTAIFEAILPNILAALRGEKVAGSLTPEVEPKPALPLEAPPPPEDLDETPVPPSAEGEEKPGAEGEEKPAAEGEGEGPAADGSLDDDDTPPTIVPGPTT